MKYTPRLILERLYGHGLTVSAAAGKLHVSGEAEPPPEVMEALRQQKAEVIALLSAMPTYSPEDERRLCDWYASRPRSERLAMHHRSNALRRDRQWPFHIADLTARAEAWEAAGKPAGPLTMARDGIAFTKDLPDFPSAPEVFSESRTPGGHGSFPEKRGVRV